MAEKRHRSTKEEVINTKLLKNSEVREKLLEKIKALEAEAVDLNQQLKDLTDVKKKAERAAEAKAKKEAKKKLEKEVMQIIKKSGLSMEEILAKLSE